MAKRVMPNENAIKEQNYSALQVISNHGLPITLCEVHFTKQGAMYRICKDEQKASDRMFDKTLMRIW